MARTRRWHTPADKIALGRIMRAVASASPLHRQPGSFASHDWRTGLHPAQWLRGLAEKTGAVLRADLAKGAGNTRRRGSHCFWPTAA
jgi:hypothetical protein